MNTIARHAATIIALIPSLSSYANHPTDRPNILWIVSEDNTLLLGCYGDPNATTPHIDQLASEGVLYRNAFCTAPVSAPTRSSLLTGMYPPSIGSHNMRSRLPLPPFHTFYTQALINAGYYCCNTSKEDYNTSSDYSHAWHQSNNSADRKNRKTGQPFFQIINTNISHESSIFKHKEKLNHKPQAMVIPPYLPDLPEIRYDRALYYDRISEMDNFVGEQLQRLEEEGVADNTIVFYYGDNGGVLGRSKRFCYDNGLHVPLIIRFPKRWQHLAPSKPGSESNRIVSFVDFPSTILSLLNIEIDPTSTQGEPFLGAAQTTERTYAYMFRDRMDERYDMVRVVRGKRYKYNRNYMPHRIHGQHINYLWQASGIQAWERAFREGRCSPAQSAFWSTKPAEELYDLEQDPHEIVNLASSDKHQPILKEMRNAHRQWELDVYDVGFIPEAELIARLNGQSPWEMVRNHSFPYKRVYETADMATLAQENDFSEIASRLNDQEACVRYWAVIGCTLQPNRSSICLEQLKTMARNDSSISVRIAAAEAIHQLGNSNEAMEVLRDIIDTNDGEFERLLAFNVVDVIGDTANELRRHACSLYPAFEKGEKYDERIIIYWRELIK